MKHLLIIGARGFGREIYNLFVACRLEDMTCKGFLDDKADALSGYCNYPPIISSVEEYEVREDDVFICALGDVRYKKLYAEKILAKGGKFISLIHPDAHVSMNTSIGCGCIIEKNAVLSCDASLGDFVTVMPSAVLGHDISIGSWSHVGSFSFMGGFSKLGESVTLHPSVNILPHKVIGNNSVVGAGSVVIRSVKEGITVVGNPAKKLEIE